MSDESERRRRETTGVLPTIPHVDTRQVVPERLDASQRDRIRDLLGQDRYWVRRDDWEDFLEHGRESTLVPIDSLTSDQRVAAVAWLRQQRHGLHRSVVHDAPPPENWLESQPLYQRLTSA